MFETVVSLAKKSAALIAISFFTQELIAQQNPPTVIPALKEWTGTPGAFTVKKGVRLVIDPAAYTQLLPVAQTFIGDLKQAKGIIATFTKSAKPLPGDIYFTLNCKDSLLGKEGYLLEVGKTLTIRANTAPGAFWATRTLLQILESQKGNNAIPAGLARDYPNYPVRGFVIDVARKFYSLEFLRNYVKFMSYYKMNDFHIHLNDNGFKQFFGNNWDSTYSAFRLESDYFPGLTAKDGHYTKKEFKDLQAYARQYGVNIIPEIDVPAHSLAFAKLIPEIGSKAYGADHLDLNNPRTYSVIDSVFQEYLSGPDPVFSGKEVHIGTDEYSKKEAEKFRAFTDRYIRLGEKFGKKVRLWGALTHAAGTTPVKSNGVTMNLWYNGYANPKDMIDAGYDLVSTPDGWLYIVPAAGYYFDYLNLKNIYDKWEPNMIGDQTFEKGHPQIKGGAFALWNDHVGNGITQQDAHDRVFPAMQVLAQKMWTGATPAVNFESYTAKAALLGEGPGLNYAAKFPANTHFEIPTPGRFSAARKFIQTAYKEIGYNYTVSFSINPAKGNPADAVLFSSPNASVKLKQQQTGKIGFSREGYNYNFDYTVPEETWTNIVITGDNKGTALFVNGTLVQRLVDEKVSFPGTKDKISKIQTLFFPLQRIGDAKNPFTGSIRKLNVYNRKLTDTEIKTLSGKTSN